MSRRFSWTACALAMGLLGFAGLRSHAEEPEATPKIARVGAPAPAFRLNDQAGKAVALFDKAPGVWTVLAFYPRAMTPG